MKEITVGTWAFGQQSLSASNKPTWLSQKTTKKKKKKGRKEGKEIWEMPRIHRKAGGLDLDKAQEAPETFLAVLCATVVKKVLVRGGTGKA
jgi:hypothetical protein